MSKITTLFLDIGGVVLTNGWDRAARQKAVKTFGIDWEEFEKLHVQWYNALETDAISLDHYLEKVIFWKKRDFTLARFRQFMFEQSKPLPEMIEFFQRIKKQHHLKIVFVSNESREIAEYRIKAFNLKALGDHFFVSCFVYYQKPNPHIYKIALDVTQVPVDEIIYIDDRENLIKAGAEVGLKGILHTSLKSTEEQLQKVL